MAADEISNEIILEHLQSMTRNLGKKFDSPDLRFDKLDERTGKIGTLALWRLVVTRHFVSA